MTNSKKLQHRLARCLIEAEADRSTRKWGKSHKNMKPLSARVNKKLLEALHLISAANEDTLNATVERALYEYIVSELKSSL